MAGASALRIVRTGMPLHLRTPILIKKAVGTEAVDAYAEYVLV